MPYLPNHEARLFGEMYALIVCHFPRWNTAGRYANAQQFPGRGVAQATAEAARRGIAFDVAAVQERAAQIDSEHADWQTDLSGQSHFALGYERTMGAMPKTSKPKQRANAKWNAENIRAVKTNLRADYAEAFAQRCRDNGTTPSAVLRAAVDAYMEEEPQK